MNEESIVLTEKAIEETAEAVYEFGSVSGVTMAGMIFTIIISIGLPIYLLLFCLKKSKAKLPSFFVGGITFILFALVLKSIVIQILYKGAGVDFNSFSPMLYAACGGIFAAVFEESGRYLAMKLVMKKKNLLDLHNSFLYGVGHGGFESIIIVGMTCISNVIVSIMINNGNGPSMIASLPVENQAAYFEGLSQLWTTPAGLFYVAGLERILAIVLQICFSIIIFQAVKHHKVIYFIVALVAHFLIDFVCGWIGQGNLSAIIISQIVLVVMTISLVFITFAITGKEKI